MKKNSSIICCLFVLLATPLQAWPGLSQLGAPKVDVQNIVSSLKAKLSSVRAERPQAIAALEKRVRADGQSYYESLGQQPATIPCGTSRGYILDDGLSLLNGLQTIALSEVPPGAPMAKAEIAMAKYRKMVQRIRQDADPSFLSGEGESATFLNFLARFGEVLWDGKVIRQTSRSDVYNLYNKIFSSRSGLEKFQADVYYLDETRSTINIDYSPSRYQLIRNIRDEIRQVDENLYLGKAFYKGTHSDQERLILYFALDFSASPRCEKRMEKSMPTQDKLPNGYPELTGCQKRNILWDRISASQYDTPPTWDEVDAFGLLSQTLTGTLAKKMDTTSDVVPAGWDKPIHAQGSVAQVKLDVDESATHPYTGLFRASSSCALLRLSLTGSPGQKAMLGLGGPRGVAPGLALKLFVDGRPSQDISLLTSLTGQGMDTNFFAYEFSNQVAAVKTPEMMAVHQAYKTVSTYPERLSVAGASEWLPDGSSVAAPVAPSKIVFVPVYDGMRSKSAEAAPLDIRAAFHSIPTGTTLFEVYAEVDPAYDGGEQMRHFIGKIVTVSPFVSSQFGDEKIFFKHRRFERDHQRK